MPHDKIDQRPLQSEHVAKRRHHDVLDLSVRNDLFERHGKVLQNHDRLGAGILELVLKLARGVERIDVDHRTARAQDAEYRHRVLQHIGHHHRDPRTRLQALGLEPGRECARHAIELTKRQTLAHAGVSLAVGKPGDALVHQVLQ